MSRKLFWGLLFLAVIAASAFSPAYIFAKDKVTLKAVTFQGKHVTFVDAYFMFQKRLEEAADGKLTLNYVGGPEAIPPFEQIEAVKSGLVDLAFLPAAYYVPQLAVADAVKLSKISPWEERRTGAYDFLNQLHQQKVNAVYLGRFSNGIQFHIYLNKKIDKPDFSGLKIRVTPVYKPFVEALGGVSVTTSPGEVYTALERGVVDGYGWPSIKISDFGWHEVTKYVVDPGFYQVDVCILVNLDSWNRLPKDLQQLLTKVAEKVEHEASEYFAKIIQEEREFIASKGMQVIKFSSADEKQYLETAYQSGWDRVFSKSPADAGKLQKMIDK
jgi:TRAP-type C4-dicarboxylate transport system substrate-binding protein